MTKQENIDLLNRIVNQPEVLQGVAPGYLSLDMSSFFDKPGNLMVGDERGVVLFAPVTDGVYEMHYLFTSSLRGRKALHAIQAAMTALFTQREAYAITGQTPRDNRPARAMNRALGGRPYGVSVDSSGRHCINYILERATWAHFLH